MKANQTNLPDWLWRLRGWWRMKFGLCPECNSDAPALDTCRVCDGYDSRINPFPPHLNTLGRWHRRFEMSRCTHGVPMESSCEECSTWLRDHINAPKGNPRRG